MTTTTKDRRVPRYAIVQAGYVGRERYASKDEAQAECDRLNREASAEVGEDVIGDGAASVIDTEVDETRPLGH